MCSKLPAGTNKKTGLEPVIFVVELVRNSLHEIVEESRQWREILYVDYAKYRLDNNYNIP